MSAVHWSLDAMDNFYYTLNLNLVKEKGIDHHIQKEHNEISWSDRIEI